MKTSLVVFSPPKIEFIYILKFVQNNIKTSIKIIFNIESVSDFDLPK